MPLKRAGAAAATGGNAGAAAAPTKKPRAVKAEPGVAPPPPSATAKKPAAEAAKAGVATKAGAGAKAGAATKAGAAAKAGATTKAAKPRPVPACVSPHTAPLPVRARCGRLRFGDLAPDLAKAFRPRLTPEQVIRAGSFGGIYFNPVGGKPGIHGRVVDIDPTEFPAPWFEGLPTVAYAGRRYDVTKNCYGVKAGQDQAFWEEKGWIRRDLDPRGWFHWYCRFYLGRRTTDGEDERQISRWVGVAGAKGRWRRALANKTAAKGLPADRAHEASPVIAQTLLHWADKLVDKDVEAALARVGGE
jgi:hypothetical protein